MRYPRSRGYCLPRCRRPRRSVAPRKPPGRRAVSSRLTRLLPSQALFVEPTTIPSLRHTVCMCHCPVPFKGGLLVTPTHRSVSVIHAHAFNIALLVVVAPPTARESQPKLWAPSERLRYNGSASALVSVTAPILPLEPPRGGGCHGAYCVCTCYSYRPCLHTRIPCCIQLSQGTMYGSTGTCGELCGIVGPFVSRVSVCCSSWCLHFLLFSLFS